MADWVPIPGFSDQTYALKSANLAVDRCINVYPSSNQVGIGKPKALIARPGTDAFCTSLTGTGRCLWAGEGILIAIVGSSMYNISTGGVATIYGGTGEVGSGTSPCQIFSNGTQLMVINPNSGVLRVWNGAAWVTPTMPTGSGLMSQGAYLDGYGFAVEKDTNRIFQSSLLDFTNWTASGAGGDYADRVTEQDRIVTILSDHNYLWILGSKTSEAWRNVGSSGFVLERAAGTFVESGTESAFAPVSGMGGIITLESSNRGFGRVVMITPGRVTPISTQAVETAIQGYGPTFLNGAVGYMYDSQGHNFYVLSIPGVGVQWVYDFTERAWHERYLWSSPGGSTSLAPGYMHANAFNGFHYVLDVNGKIWTQRENLFTDGGANMVGRRIVPLIVPGAKRVMVHGVRLDQQVGSGATQGATLNVSRDGGKTWGPDRVYDTLLDGEVEWRMLGKSSVKGMGLQFTWTGAEMDNLAVAGGYYRATEATS